MTDDGGVVDGDTAVAGKNLSIFRDHHGVDFDQSCSIVLKGFVQAEDESGDLGDMGAGDLDLVGEVQGVVDLESADDIHVHHCYLVGRNGLDVHAALRGKHD